MRSGYSCAYMNTISWASETAGLPMEIDPRARLSACSGVRAVRPSGKCAGTKIAAFSIQSSGSAFPADESRRSGSRPFE
jgi:hypothetical protein